MHHLWGLDRDDEGSHSSLLELVLHHLQEDLDGFLPIVPFIFLDIMIPGMRHKNKPQFFMPSID